LILLERLSKDYGSVRALRKTDLQINQGVFGLLGPNGAGKTTLIRMAATTLPPTAGSVTVCGHDTMREPLAIRKMLGYLPQDFGAYPKLKGSEYLEYIAILKNLRRPKTQINALLSQFNLTDVARRWVTTYSGGTLRRLGIAQALLGSPRVLLIDEPTSGLDPEERVRFREFLMNLGSDRIVVLSTHFVEDVAMTCDYLGVLDHGELRYHGTPRALIAVYEHKIFEVTIPDEEVKEKLDAWGQRVLSTRREADGRAVRLLGEVEGGREVIPSLEDAYLALLRT